MSLVAIPIAGSIVTQKSFLPHDRLQYFASVRVFEPKKVLEFSHRFDGKLWQKKIQKLIFHFSHGTFFLIPISTIVHESLTRSLVEQKIDNRLTEKNLKPIHSRIVFRMEHNIVNE